MNKLQFRIYDTELKELSYTYPKKYSEKLNDKNFSKLDIDIAAICMDGSIVLLDECGRYKFLPGDRFILTQYTGFKDRNGKELWEGDLCYYTFFHNSKIIGEIVYYTGAFVLLRKNETIPLCNYMYFEKVGDIFENPELLNIREEG